MGVVELSFNHSFYFVIRHPATAKWYDRRDTVFVDFCVEDSKDVQVRFDTAKVTFR